MAKAGVVELDGEIIEVLPAGNYSVKLDNSEAVAICKKSGKMRQSHISVIEGDKVKVELSVYDLKQGRIVYRYNVATNAA